MTINRSHLIQGWENYLQFVDEYKKFFEARGISYDFESESESGRGRAVFSSGVINGRLFVADKCSRLRLFYKEFLIIEFAAETLKKELIEFLSQMTYFIIVAEHTTITAIDSTKIMFRLQKLDFNLI